MILNKNIYRATLLLSFLAINGLILFGISSLWSYLNTGADRSTMLHLPEARTANYMPEVVWGPLNNEGRPMEEQTLNEIERDYLKAWQVRNIALENNSSFGVSDYYTDSARVKLFQILELNKANNTTIKSTTLQHHPSVDFYSADGKLVVLTDDAVERYEELYFDGNLLFSQRSTSSYQIMLLLEDGFWRIRHLVEIPDENYLVEEPIIPSLEGISEIKGINYYPEQHPWNMFGKQFKEHIIDHDFSIIKSLGLNTVRLFVPYEAFGKAEINAQKLEQLKHTLDIALKKDLKVMLTLFDFYGDYGLQDWTLTNRHAVQIVNALKDHEALQSWDIKNEPDLDFESRGKDKVLAWLNQMLLTVKQCDTIHPVTIGWSNPEAATNLSKKVDYVSFHYYRDPADFLEAYNALNNKVDKKPLVLQEFGYSSYSGIWNGFLGSENDQMTYYEAMDQILKEAHIPSLFWTLYDFKKIPTSVVGRLPWRKARQRYFGIIDSDGNPKKSYSRFSGNP